MKNKAFVKYTKKGRLVPGSLIITNGSCPKGPGIWQEVPINICCTSPISPCTCYVLANPSLKDEYEYSYVPCGETESLGSLLPAGGRVAFCANTNSLEKANGILTFSQSSCIPSQECERPTICFTYSITNNSLSPTTISYINCDDAEIEIILNIAESTTICALLGTITIVGSADWTPIGFNCLT